MSEEKEMTSIELVCPYNHERMRFFLASDIFNEDELKDDLFIDKYNLDPKYRDYKLLSDQDFPAGYDVDKVQFCEDGYARVVSIRAMHRICCEDLLTDQMHFFFHRYTKWHILDYDNMHGSIIKSFFQTRKLPAKFNLEIIFRDDDDTLKKDTIKVFHMDSLWNLGGSAGLLLYFFDDVKSTIGTAYIDTLTDVVSVNIKF